MEFSLACWNGFEECLGFFVFCVVKTGVYTGRGFVYLIYFWIMRETVIGCGNDLIVLRYYKRLCEDKCESFIYFIIDMTLCSDNLPCLRLILATVYSIIMQTNFWFSS